MQGEEAFQESVRSMRHQTLRADRAGDYWTDYEKKRLRVRFDSGIGITEIALELGRTEPAVYQQIEKNGPVRAQAESAETEERQETS